MNFFEKWYKPFMVLSTVVLIYFSAINHRSMQVKINELQGRINATEQMVDKLSDKVDTLTTQIKTLMETHPYANPKKWKSRTGLCTQGNLLGFLLYCPVDTTNISDQFKLVLSSYEGPTAKVNSLRRGFKGKSAHAHGRAIDLAWDETVIEFLISERGKSWLDKHGITMYIEGQPGCRKVKKYLSDPIAKDYVFFNPEASGPHVHLNI